MKTLNQTLKEFDEKFNFLYCMENVENDIKSFLSQSIKTALESVVVEKHCEDEIGWNDCREQLLKNIENYLKN